MATQITQRDNSEEGVTTLQVEGDMLLDDALLIQRIADSVIAETAHKVVIDLADLDFMDSDAAAILRQLTKNSGVVIEGVEIFLQSAVDMAERS